MSYVVITFAVIFLKFAGFFNRRRVHLQAQAASLLVFMVNKSKLYVSRAVPTSPSAAPCLSLFSARNGIHSHLARRDRVTNYSEGV